MELSAAQRKLAFALVVFALAGLGVYLFTSTGHPAASAAAQSAGRQPGRQAAPAADTPSANPPPTGPPPTDSPASGSSTPSGLSLSLAPDIYRWLPFTKTGLSAAAKVVVKFGDAYATFSYTQNAAAYVATMHDLVTQQLGQQIAAAYSTPGVTTLRKSRKQVSTGAATITSLRAFGSNSLTFVVAVTEQITATRGGGSTTTGYAVTVTGGDTNWQVSDIELASAGNF